MPPPMTPRCAAWRSGRRVTRQPLHPGTRRTAPTVFFSTSKAPRICSAAKRSCSPIFLHGSNISACRRDLPSPIRLVRRGRCRACIPPPAACCLRARKPGRSRRCPSKHCGFRQELARPCAGSVSNPSARFSTSRARPLPRVFRPSCSGASTRRSAASTSRSCLSLRRRSIIPYVICSNRSSRRRPSLRWRTASCTRSCMCSRATMSGRARSGFRFTASMARWRRSISD